MDEASKACPTCGGTIKTEDGHLDQSTGHLAAIVETCTGGKTAAYGCGHKSWRRKEPSKPLMTT